MTAQWLGNSAATLALVLVCGIGIDVTLLALTRLAGLRSFSKMSSFDFETTGDISVLRHGESFEPWLLAEVRGAADAA